MLADLIQPKKIGREHDAAGATGKAQPVNGCHINIGGPFCDAFDQKLRPGPRHGRKRPEPDLCIGDPTRLDPFGFAVGGNHLGNFRVFFAGFATFLVKVIPAPHGKPETARADQDFINPAASLALAAWPCGKPADAQLIAIRE